MKQVTIAAVDYFLLDDMIQWADGFKLKASIPTMQEVGLSAIEARRPLATTLRLSASFSVVLVGALSVVSFRNQTQLLTTENVICPLWCFQIEAGDMPTVTGDYYVVYDGNFVATVEPAASAPFAGTAFPAMFGRFDQTPQPGMITGNKSKCAITFIENSPRYISFPAFAPSISFDGGLGAVAVMPFFPNWSKQLAAGGAEFTIERRNLGNTRDTSDAYYTQDARRVVTSEYDIRTGSKILSMFLACAGDVKAFWLPALLSDVALSVDIVNGDNNLTVADSSQIGTEQYIILDNLDARFAAKISSVVGNVLNISPNASQAFTAYGTRVESLIFARFNKNEIDLDFTSPGLCNFKSDFIELPYETAVQAGETLGTTFGALPTTAILFTYTMVLPTGGSEIWRFTNFESDVTNGGYTYVSCSMEFDSITETDTIERQKVTVKSRNFSGNPCALFLPLASELPVTLVITEADIAAGAASNLHILFQGEISSVTNDGPYLEATVDSLSSWFDRKIPRRLLNNDCNWILFESKCTLLKTNFTWTGNVDSYDPATFVLVLNTVASSNGATLVAHYFSGGYLTVGTGTTIQARLVSDSAAISGGLLTLQLSQPFNVAPSVGAVVTLFPGCDGIATTCINKFNNYPNFGGFPFIPVANPTIFQSTQPAYGGGKK